MTQLVNRTLGGLSALFMVFSSPLQAGAPAAGTKSDVLSLMQRVADYQLEHPRHPPTDWTNGAFYAGVMALYESSRDPRYLARLQAIAAANEYRPGPRLRHADDHAVSQTYLDLFRITGDQAMLVPTRATFDELMSDPQPGRVDWWWCDALFMAPPALAKLAAVTGEPRYRDFMDHMWWDTVEFLYDPSEALFFRDANFFDKRERNGQKIFWSRGNGWVLAGLARVLRELPAEDPGRARYEVLFKAMADRVRGLQQADGFWRPSLLDPASTPSGESSGTGFYVFALAYGVNEGLLEAAEFTPTIHRGWQALVGAVEPSGRLGWVQPIGYQPEPVRASDSDVYGVGAFLLAGSEVVKLVEAADRSVSQSL